MYKLIIITALALLSCTKPTADPSHTSVQYTESLESFPNPERGFYHYSISEYPLTERKVRDIRKENISLIFRVYYLKDFRSKPISDAFIALIDADMQSLRNGGGKAIVRFSYANTGSEPDAPLAIVLQHLEQLRPVLQRNADVIAFFQAGFIGAWGEWHSSSNKLATDENRQAILSKLLEVLPPNRFVQVRKPAYIPPQHPRVGLHNDCFLSSPNDVGTYKDVSAEKTYLHQAGLSVPIGGETCKPRDIAIPDCAKTLHEMRYLRFTYLNRSFYQETTNSWIAKGCFAEIDRNMGYRFVLKEASFPQQIAPGSQLSLSITLRNVGYAPLYNPRQVYLILRSTASTTAPVYSLPLPTDPRRWLPDTDTTLQATLSLPANIPTGSYELLLSLPDSAPSLSNRPEFAIRFANHQCWEPTTGYNRLGATVLITPN